MTQEDLVNGVLSQFPDIFEQILRINQAFGALQEKREKNLVENWQKSHEEQKTKKKQGSMKTKLQRQLAKTTTSLFKNQSGGVPPRPHLGNQDKTKKMASSNQLFLNSSHPAIAEKGKKTFV